MKSKPAPILSASFKWNPASSHSDVAAFAERQRARMAAAQKQSNVKPIRKVKA